MPTKKKPKRIKLELSKLEEQHIINEPRKLICVGKTEETIAILEYLKGKHDDDLVLEVRPKQKKLYIFVAEIKGHVCVRSKWINGKNYKKYYSVIFARNLDGSLKMWT